jgi:transcriptional regulator with XRE-family HTH domain
MKGALNRELENPRHRAEFDHRRGFFRLEVQFLLALEDRGWSYEDLAKATGILRQNIRRDLKNGGLHKASLDRVARYAEALGLHAHHFLLSPVQERKFLPRLEKALALA